jgi:hypothetical protein
MESKFYLIYVLSTVQRLWQSMFYLQKKKINKIFRLWNATFRI